MKNLLKFLVVLLFLPKSGNANNLTISNITATSADVTFSLSWENSWNISGMNYDAVWLFVKSQDCSGSKTWDHVDFAATGHTVGGTVLEIIPSSDGKGAFIKRKSDGSGNISSTQVTIKFLKPFASVSSVNFDVNGIEMVYVPKGSFLAGDNSTSGPSGYAFASGTSAGARLIASEAEMAKGYLANPSASYTTHPLIPAAFPKGYESFYCMKYEITQNQYAHFLNLLTHTQQTYRTVSPSAPIGTGALRSPLANRQGIKLSVPATGNPVAPATFGCDLNNDLKFDDVADGGSIACNWLSWDDLRAYLDWSALRPMTELEFEKACRGPESALAGVFPWGSTQFIVSGTTVNNSGQANETVNPFGPGLCNAANSGSFGPLRVGFAATAGTGRLQSGGSYYGIMELAGNVWEQAFTVGTDYTGDNRTINTSPTFTGAHGDGKLNSIGHFDVTGWGIPGDAANSIIRGGGFDSAAVRCGVSDRQQHMDTPRANLNRLGSIGGRGVRTN